jgi:hypothetical protein
LVIFFVHSTGILCRIGTKHEILVRKSRENPLEKNLSIVISFVVMTKCMADMDPIVPTSWAMSVISSWRWPMICMPPAKRPQLAW